MDQQEIVKRFTYHPPQSNQAGRYAVIREWALNFALKINELTPASREQSLSITALEECVMRANAAIAINESHAQPYRNLTERLLNPPGDKINGVPVAAQAKQIEPAPAVMPSDGAIYVGNWVTRQCGHTEEVYVQPVDSPDPDRRREQAVRLTTQLQAACYLPCTKCAKEASEKPAITGDTSDGYHTFNELYEHRHALFTCLMKAYPELSWYSKKHHDGSVMDGWFLAGMHLPDGDISYHLPDSWMHRMLNLPNPEKAPAFDGHTSRNVVERLIAFSYRTKERINASEK